MMNVVRALWPMAFWHIAVSIGVLIWTTDNGRKVLGSFREASP